ncbi:MAG: hypothetical protein KC545_05070, partial [Nitrospira sp.]|nr:hypothetical protein [Nitrospira sp.]
QATKENASPPLPLTLFGLFLESYRGIITLQFYTSCPRSECYDCIRWGSYDRDWDKNFLGVMC